MRTQLLCCLLALTTSSDAARILCVFPIGEPSHHFIYRPVMEELARRGHNITYVTGIPYEEPPKGISQVDLSKNEEHGRGHFSFVEFGQLSIPSALRLMYRHSLERARRVLETKEVQELIHSDQKFDAVIIESYNANEYLSAFIHKFNAIGIELMNLGDCSWTNELAGLPDNPAYQLDYRSPMTNDMNFWQRLYNTYVTSVTTLGRYYYMKQMQYIVDKYFDYEGWEARPPIDVLARNRSLLLVNFDYLFGYPYPAPPHRKDIGGINVRPNKPLPKDLQQFMDESKEGVIYMSLGSHMKTSDIGNEIQKFMSVFKKLSQRVLLKFETQYPGELPPNVKLSNWFPQQDILAHNNCVLFITHGGLLSITEATYYGIPLLGIPFFADQEKNMVYVESEGFGKMLKYKNISTETILWTLREVLSNKRYKEEIERRSVVLKDRRHTPAEEAAYWVEHSLTYPYILTPKSTSLTAVQLHLLDIKLFVVAVFFLTLVAISLVIYFVREHYLKPKRRSKQKLY